MANPQESLEAKIRRVLNEAIEVVAYDSRWPEAFEEEKFHLISCLPPELLGRIEHFGSTAVPGLCSKPIVDMLVEVTSLDQARTRIAPILEKQRYDYFWRPTEGEDGPPFYAWFIKRDRNGKRSHHIHMVESHFEHWDGLLFRDYLRRHPDAAREYGILKQQLSAVFGRDRIGYTRSKAEFIRRVTEQAKRSSRD